MRKLRKEAYLVNELEKLRLRLNSYRSIDQAIIDQKPLEEIAALAIDSLAAWIPFERISIALMDASSDEALILAARVHGNKATQLGGGKKVPAKVFGEMVHLYSGQHQEVSRISDLADDHPLKAQLQKESIKSYVIIPLSLHEELIGVLNIGRKNEDGFTREEIDTLQEIGGQVAMSICQAKLNQQNLRQKEELSILLDISYLLTKSLDLKDVLQVTIDEATRAMGLESGAIYLLTGEELFLGATTPPLPPDFPHQFRIALLEHHPHIKSALDSQQPVFLPDTKAAELTPQEQAVSDQRDLRSLLYVPLIAGSRPVGVIILGTTGHTTEFSESQVNLSRTFSVQMALAVENARLFQETQLQASIMERQVAERTDELSALTHAISHDLRAPLRAIQGYGQALIQDFGAHLDPEGKQLLERMVAASENLEGMFDGLLSLTQMGQRKMKLEFLDLSTIAERILAEMCAAEKDRRIEYVVEPCGESCKTFFSDRVYSEIVLSNLISNAIKFTKGKDPARIRFGCKVENDERTFFMEDNGVGFNMEHSPQIFLPFQRLHAAEEFDGFGIGLTVVKKIIDLHEGRIWVESEEGKGTTVYFSVKDLSEKEQEITDLI
jgi:signal transduction histidine kinase